MARWQPPPRRVWIPAALLAAGVLGMTLSWRRRRGSRHAPEAPAPLPVPDADLAHLELPAYNRGEQGVRGPDVTLHAELAGARRTWQGYVVRTEDEIDPHTRMLRLVARIDDPYAPQSAERTPLPLGLFVDAEIGCSRGSASPPSTRSTAISSAAWRSRDCSDLPTSSRPCSAEACWLRAASRD